MPLHSVEVGKTALLPHDTEPTHLQTPMHGRRRLAEPVDSLRDPNSQTKAGYQTPAANNKHRQWHKALKKVINTCTRININSPFGIQYIEKQLKIECILVHS